MLTHICHPVNYTSVCSVAKNVSIVSMCWKVSSDTCKPHVSMLVQRVLRGDSRLGLASALCRERTETFAYRSAHTPTRHQQRQHNCNHRQAASGRPFRPVFWIWKGP